MSRWQTLFIPNWTWATACSNSVQQHHDQAAAGILCVLGSLTNTFQHLQQPFEHMLHTENEQ